MSRIELARSAEWKFLASGIYEPKLGCENFRNEVENLLKLFFCFAAHALEKVSRKINVKLNRIRREKLLNFKAKL